MTDFANFRILVDTPSSAPGLNFGAYADALAHSVANSRPQFAIGIYGAWGSGKTTLMNAVRDRLSKANTVVVEFSAWRYEKEEYLLVPLLDTIREALINWADARQKEDPADQTPGLMRKAATVIGKIATSIVAGISFKVGVPDAFELSFEAAKALERARMFDDAAADEQSNLGPRDIRGLVAARGTSSFPQSVYHTCFRQLRVMFTALREKFTELRVNGGDLRFVVFVDDLDRCLPAGALEVLEAIKLFFENEGFVFVVGLDRAIVERFIEQSYPQITVREEQAAAPAASPVGNPPGPSAFVERKVPLISGADYIKKIFQVPFTLAPVQLSQLDELITAIQTGSDLQQDQIDDLKSCVLPHLRVALSDVAVNPREVKRYINAYVLQMKIKPHLDANMVLALQTINARPDWDRVRKAIELRRDEFLTALRAEFAAQPQAAAGPAARRGSDGPLGELDQEYAALPQSFFDYVDPVIGAGTIMLNAAEAGRFDEYLFSSESTTSSHGSALLAMLPLLSRARRTVLDAGNKVGANAQDAYSMAQGLMSSAHSMLSSSEAQPAIRALSSQMDALTEAIKPPEPGGIGTDHEVRHAKQLAADIEVIIQRVRALRRQDSGAAA
jgi:hypothetical protein